MNKRERGKKKSKAETGKKQTVHSALEGIRRESGARSSKRKKTKRKDESRSDNQERKKAKVTFFRGGDVSFRPNIWSGKKGGSIEQA